MHIPKEVPARILASGASSALSEGEVHAATKARQAASVRLRSIGDPRVCGDGERACEQPENARGRRGVTAGGRNPPCPPLSKGGWGDFSRLQEVAAQPVERLLRGHG